MITEYSILKDHFNKLLFGGYPNNSGLETIRDAYPRTFGIGINLHDVYSTPLRIRSNNISEIITLIGPEEEEINEDDIFTYPTGIMANINNIVYLNIFNEDILKGLNGKDALRYAIKVHNIMLDIVLNDSLYPHPNKVSRKKQPLYEFVKSVPLYFTYHHIKDCIPCVLENDDNFMQIIEKYYTCGEDALKLLKSLENNKYSEKIEDIYRTVSCDGTIEFF